MGLCAMKPTRISYMIYGIYLQLPKTTSCNITSTDNLERAQGIRHFVSRAKSRKKQPASTKRFIEHFIGDLQWNLNILQPERWPSLQANNSEGFKQPLHPHFFWPKLWSLFRKWWDNENSMTIYLAFNQQAQIIKRGCFSPHKRTL